MSRKMQDETSSRLERHSVRLCEEGLIDQLVRFARFTVKDQLLDLRQCRSSLFIIITISPTSPNGFFIELQLFTLWYSIYHRSQTPITDGSSLFPDLCICRLVIP